MSTYSEQNLSEAVTLYEPSTTTKTSSPELIVMFGWFAAQEAHLAKYLKQHQTMFPSSRIMLIRAKTEHILPHRTKAQLKAAIDFFRSLPSDPDRPPILIHVFSNGGLHALAHILQSVVTLPPHITILDSCPGYFHWGRVYRGLAMPLPALLKPLIHLVLIFTWLIRTPRGLDWPMNANAALVNSDPVTSSELRRLYLYGTGDVVVASHDVERHAAEAKAAGLEVRAEPFEGGKHVAHVRVDADRYWAAVKDIWEQ